MILFFGSTYALLKEISAPNSSYFACAFFALGYYTFSLWCIGAGQTSCVAVSILTLFFILIRRSQFVWSGFCLSLAYYKPPIFLGLILVLLFAKQWKVLLGFAIGGLLLLALTIYSVGFETTLFYIEQASNYRYGQNIISSQSLPTDRGVGILAALESLKITNSTYNQVFVLALSAVLAFLLSRKFLIYLHPKILKSDDMLLIYTVCTSFSLLTSLQMVNYDLSILFPFMVGSLIVLLRDKKFNLKFIIFLSACILMYFEEYFRNLNFIGFTIKGTTIIWIVGTFALYLLSAERIKNLQPNSSSSPASSV